MSAPALDHLIAAQLNSSGSASHLLTGRGVRAGARVEMCGFLEMAGVGWLSLKTMEDEINYILSRAESKFCTPNGDVCMSRTVGLVTRGHIVAGDFHYIGKEGSTRWAGGPDPSMMADAGALDPTDETCREYERVIDTRYLDQIRTEARQFSNKVLSRQSGVARCAIINFKKGKNTIKSRTLRKLTKAIHDLQNKNLKN